MSRSALYPRSTWIVCVLLIPLGLLALGIILVATTDAETLLFDRPGLWWLGFAAPVAGLLILYGVARRRRALARFAAVELACLLAPSTSPTRQASRSALIVISILMIVVAVIGPRWGIYMEKQEIYGVDIVVALDVSRSMLARDVAPDRIGRAKQEIRQQLTERAVFRRAHRLALLAFAGSTSLRLPLTTDHLAFRSKLDAVRVGSAPRGGTAIAEAIRAAGELFARSPEEATKIILLFTDGEDHQGQAAQTAQLALEQQGIRTFTIGVGDPASAVGAQVPIGDGTNRPLLFDGQIVFSKLDVPGMQQIAESGGGRFASIADLSRLVEAISDMHKSRLTSEDRIRYKPRYQWFIAAALLLLAVETMMKERRPAVENVPLRTWQEEATT